MKKNKIKKIIIAIVMIIIINIYNYIQSNINQTSKGLYSGTKYNKENNDHLYTVWNKLQNINFCIEICALVLLHAASMVGVSVSKNDNYTFTTAENKKIITRYNGIGDEAKAYGERNYKTYTVFEKYNKLSRE